MWFIFVNNPRPPYECGEQLGPKQPGQSSAGPAIPDTVRVQPRRGGSASPSKEKVDGAVVVQEAAVMSTYVSLKFECLIAVL